MTWHKYSFINYLTCTVTAVYDTPTPIFSTLNSTRVLIFSGFTFKRAVSLKHNGIKRSKHHHGTFTSIFDLTNGQLKKDQWVSPSGTTPPVYKPMAHSDFHQRSRWRACNTTLHLNKLMGLIAAKDSVLQRGGGEKCRACYLTTAFDQDICTALCTCYQFPFHHNCNTSLLALNMKGDQSRPIFTRNRGNDVMGFKKWKQYLRSWVVHSVQDQ